MENGQAPATKADIAEVKQEIAEVKQDVAEVKQDVAEFKQEVRQEFAMVRSEMQHMYDNLVERISDSETKLLNAFYTFAESNQKRLAEIENDSAAIKSRLSTVEQRLLLLEKRMNMPPQAQ